MQTSRGASMEDGQTPFANWVKMNASTANLLSIIMLIFAAWAAVEIVTNVTGTEIPPVTGIETNSDPADTQRTNNGAIIGLGAVAGTFGLVLQLLIPRDDSESAVHTEPEADEEIDEVVDIMMEDIESDDDGNDEEDSDEEAIPEVDVEEEDSTDDGDSLEEEDQVVEDEAEEAPEEEAPVEEEKTPVKKKKF